MLPRQEIENRIASIGSSLDELDRDGTLEACFEIDQLFRTLREEYRRHPEALTGLVPQLTGLSRRFDEILSVRVAQIVDRFHDINERIRRAEQEKTAWREFLIRSATRARTDRLSGSTACIRLKSQEIRQMPASGSEDRRQLEDLIRSSGCWEQVSQLSRPKLEKAIDSGQIPQAQAGDIERLCPISVMHQVSSQLL
jgi:hypothetical protein